LLDIGVGVETAADRGQGQLVKLRHRNPATLAMLVELVVDRPFVFDQRAPEGFHGGKEPLLKAGLEEGRGIPDSHRFVTKPAFAKCAVGIKLVGEFKLGSAFDRSRDENRFDLTSRECDFEVAEVFLQPINEDLIAFSGSNRDARAKALPVEDRHEPLEAVGMTVMRRG
jgi:hypothetical protein